MLIEHAKLKPARFPEPTQYKIEAGVGERTNSLCDRPMWSTDCRLWQKPVITSQQRLLGLWTRKFPFEGHFLPCCWIFLIEDTPMTEGHKMILKYETVTMSRMMPEKHSNGDGSAQKSFIIKCKRFIQDHAAWRMP